MPQEWYAAHDAASSTSMTRDPSKLALLKRKMAKKEASVVAGPPPPVPPRRSSSDLAAPADSLVASTLSEAPSTPAKPPPPLPRRRSESTRNDAPASRIPTKCTLPVSAPMTPSSASLRADVDDSDPSALIAAGASPEKHPIAVADVPIDECTEDAADKPSPAAINSMATTTACTESPGAPMDAMPVPTTVDPFARKSFQKLVVKWSCTTCKRECIPVREESRCLCGHRLKEHPSSFDDPRVKDPAKFKPFACTTSRCVCKSFFYIVAEGAWILRCRCKHKHIEHDAGRPPFLCKKPKCACTGFDSPWVCNCAHPWSNHIQTQEVKTFHPLQVDLCDELSKVYRTDLEAEPLSLHA